MSTPWITVDLVYVCTLSMAIIGYAIWTIRHIKIRLNLLNRVKWSIALVAVLMKLSLSFAEFFKKSYDGTWFKFYYCFLIDQAHFMIILTLFFSVIGSWKIVYSFGPEMKLNSDFIKTLNQLKQQKKQVNRTTLYLQAIYFVLSLALTIIIQNLFTKMNKD
jgi:hypothetical protein